MAHDCSARTANVGAYSSDPRLLPDGERSADPGSRSKAEEEYIFGESLAGSSIAIKRVRALIHRYGVTPWTVLVRGEPGTGKELVARSLHSVSDRAKAPLVTVECIARSEESLENELFGHVGGASSEVDRDHCGVLRAAGNGTVVLDEIGELPLGLQSKLLRFIEHGTYRPLGATSDALADVRLIATTNRDLKAMVEKGSFRPDLYYRLDVLQIHIPPLRERKDDICELAELFLRRFSRDRAVDLTSEARAQLRAAAWPGNVRELEHVMLRTAASVTMGPVAKISLSHMVEVQG